MQLWESVIMGGIPRDSPIGLFSNNYNNYSPVFTCQFRIRMTKN